MKLIFNQYRALVMATGMCLALAVPAVSAHAQSTEGGLRDSLQRAINELDYHPDSVELRLRKAAVNMQMEQWQIAKEEYDVVLRQDPKNLTALYYRAYANQQLHRYHFARLDYEDLLQLVPSHFEGRLGLALLNQKDHHYTEAYDQLSLMVAQYPDSAIVYVARADLEKSREQYEAAEYDLTEALRLQPQQVEWLLMRADIRLKLKHKSDALDDLNRLVSLGVERSALSSYFDQALSKKRRRKNIH